MLVTVLVACPCSLNQPQADAAALSAVVPQALQVFAVGVNLAVLGSQDSSSVPRTRAEAVTGSMLHDVIHAQTAPHTGSPSSPAQSTECYMMLRPDLAGWFMWHITRK